MIQSVLFAVAYAGVGLVLLAAGFAVIDALTPGSLRKAIFVENERGAAIVAAAGALAVGVLTFSTIWVNAESGFGTALGYTLVFGFLGIALQAVAFLLLNAFTSGRLGEVIHDERLEGGLTRVRAGAIVLASYEVAVAGVVVASIS